MQINLYCFIIIYYWIINNNNNCKFDWCTLVTKIFLLSTFPCTCPHWHNKSFVFFKCFRIKTKIYFIFTVQFCFIIAIYFNQINSNCCFEVHVHVHVQVVVDDQFFFQWFKFFLPKFQFCSMFWPIVCNFFNLFCQLFSVNLFYSFLFPLPDFFCPLGIFFFCLLQTTCSANYLCLNDHSGSPKP